MSGQAFSEPKSPPQHEADPTTAAQTNAPPPSQPEIFREMPRRGRWRNLLFKFLLTMIVSVVMNCYVNDISFNDLLWVFGLKAERDGAACSSSSSNSVGNNDGISYTLGTYDSSVIARAVQLIRWGCEAIQAQLAAGNHSGIYSIVPGEQHEKYRQACKLVAGTDI